MVVYCNVNGCVGRAENLHIGHWPADAVVTEYWYYK